MARSCNHTFLCLLTARLDRLIIKLADPMTSRFQQDMTLFYLMKNPSPFFKLGFFIFVQTLNSGAKVTYLTMSTFGAFAKSGMKADQHLGSIQHY